MRLGNAVKLVCVLVACSTPAVAKDVNIRMAPYHAGANYCPAGLQPIMAGGVICCGRPNVAEPYYDAPSQRRVAHHPQRRHAAPRYERIPLGKGLSDY